MENLKANPQLEDGYTRVANELLEAMSRYPFNGSEFRILWAVIRKTYGWKKKKDVLPFSQISKFTYLNLRYVKKIVKDLVQDNVLFKEASPNGNILSLNKNYYSWKLWKSQDLDNKIDTGTVSYLALEDVSGLTPKLVTEDAPSK